MPSSDVGLVKMTNAALNYLFHATSTILLHGHAPSCCTVTRGYWRSARRAIEVKIIRTITVQRTCRSVAGKLRTRAAARGVSVSQGFRSMCTSKQYRAKATEYKARADTAITLSEKREFQNLERSFSTLADNEQWLSNNYDKTVHALERLPASSLPKGPKREAY
jgi:hypothetical protein